MYETHCFAKTEGCMNPWGICFTFYSNAYFTCAHNYKTKISQAVLVQADTICTSGRL